MKRIGFVIAIAGLFWMTPGVSQAAPTLGAALAAHVCSACHGPDGNSATSAFPKLAGQGAGYIEKELHDFQSGKRVNAIMQAMVASLTPAEIRSVAHYFSRQTMSAGFANPKLVALGQKIFRGGLPKVGVPACMACHGPDGMGNEPARYPRLAGQWSAYLDRQLQDFAHGRRKNSPHGMMNYVASRLTPAQMKAVASYLEGLH
ncbi:MAG: c-type cytochrome [Gammaproteobacteria bacterium]